MLHPFFNKVACLVCLVVMSCNIHAASAGTDATVVVNSPTDFVVAIGNQPPIASDVSILTQLDTPVSSFLLATDANIDSLSYRINTIPTNGIAIILNQYNNSFTYTPNIGFHGNDSFSFIASDGLVDSNPGMVTVLVGDDINVAPVATSESLSTPHNTVLNRGLIASDVNGDPLTFIIVNNPTHGNVVMTNSAVGAYTYTPNSGFSGSDSFTFKANDGFMDSSIATITITVGNGGNASPVANNWSTSLLLNTSLTGVLSASDVDGDPLTYNLVSNATHGVTTLSNTSIGSFTYTPTIGFVGNDAFTFQVFDGTTHSNIARVQVQVTSSRGKLDSTSQGNASGSCGIGGGSAGLIIILMVSLCLRRQRV